MCPKESNAAMVYSKNPKCKLHAQKKKIHNILPGEDEDVVASIQNVAKEVGNSSGSRPEKVQCQKVALTKSDSLQRKRKANKKRSSPKGVFFAHLCACQQSHANSCSKTCSRQRVGQITKNTSVENVTKENMFLICCCRAFLTFLPSRLNSVLFSVDAPSMAQKNYFLAILASASRGGSR